MKTELEERYKLIDMHRKWQKSINDSLYRALKLQKDFATNASPTDFTTEELFYSFFSLLGEHVELLKRYRILLNKYQKTIGISKYL